MIKDLQMFGKWLNENNQVDFGKEINEDDYILTISYVDNKFLLESIDIIKDAELNYYDSSCFNDNLFFPPNQNAYIPSASDLVGFSPFFVKLNQHNFEKNNKPNLGEIDKFKKKVSKSLDHVKNGKSFIEVSNSCFDDLKNNFIDICELNEVQKENMVILCKKYSSQDIYNIIVKYYEFLVNNSQQIISMIINFKKSEKFINKRGNFYLTCVFNNTLDLINDFFYLYCNYLKIRKNTIKDYKEGICSICGEKNITYPTMTYFNLDVSFNNSSKPKMKNSKLRLCKNCSSFVKYADDKLLKILNNDHFLIIPKLKSGSYDNFLKISNIDTSSFDKINNFLKDCDNLNFDLLIINVDKDKQRLITIKKYIENYKAFLVQFEDLYLYNFKNMNYLFGEKLNSLNEDSVYKIENTFGFENIFKEFFYELEDDNNIKYPKFYNFYEIYTTGPDGIFSNFTTPTISIFSRYCENIFSFIYELNLDGINKHMINEIVLNSINIFQKRSFDNTKFKNHILKRLNYYYMFKKEFLEDYMLSDENVKILKDCLGKHDNESKVIFGKEEINSINSLIEDDPAIKYYLLGQFISYIDIMKKSAKKNGDVFSNYVNNVNRNNIKKLFITEILQKNNFYIEKMTKKAKFIFSLFEQNIDSLFNEDSFDYEDYLLLIFTGYYTENILLKSYCNEE